MLTNNSFKNFTTATGESNWAIPIRICIIFTQFWDLLDAKKVKKVIHPVIVEILRTVYLRSHKAIVIVH